MCFEGWLILNCKSNTALHRSNISIPKMTEVNNEDGSNVDGFARGRELNDLQILLTVRRTNNTAVPSETFTEQTIRDMCFMATGTAPINVDILNNTDVLLEYDKGDAATITAMQLYKTKIWYGMDVDLQVQITDVGLMNTLIRSREEERERTPIQNGAQGGPPIDVGKFTTELMARFQMQMDKEYDRIEQAFDRQKDDLKAEVSRELLNDLGFQDPVPKATEVVVKSANQKPPKISCFTGAGTPGAGEVSYGQWIYEVQALQGSYAEDLLREGIFKSLKGSAADLIRYMGPKATVEQIVGKLRSIYEPTNTYGNLMEEFFDIKQGKKETVQQFTARLEGALNEIKVQYPERFENGERERDLRERLFQGLHKSIKDTFRFQYHDPTVTYAELVVSARKAEAEEREGNRNNSAVANSKATEVVLETPREEPLITVKSLQEALAKAFQKGDGYRGSSTQRSQNSNSVQTSKNKGSDKEEGNGKQSDNRVKGPREGRMPHCWNCKGIGHLARNCPSPKYNLNEKRGEGKSPDQPPTNPQ